LPTKVVIGKSPIKINALDISWILLAIINLYVRKGGRTPQTFYFVTYAVTVVPPAAVMLVAVWVLM